MTTIQHRRISSSKSNGKPTEEQQSPFLGVSPQTINNVLNLVVIAALIINILVIATFSAIFIFDYILRQSDKCQLSSVSGWSVEVPTTIKNHYESLYSFYNIPPTPEFMSMPSSRRWAHCTPLWEGRETLCFGGYGLRYHPQNSNKDKRIEPASLYQYGPLNDTWIWSNVKQEWRLVEIVQVPVEILSEYHGMDSDQKTMATIISSIHSKDNELTDIQHPSNILQIVRQQVPPPRRYGGCWAPKYRHHSVTIDPKTAKRMDIDSLPLNEAWLGGGELLTTVSPMNSGDSGDNNIDGDNSDESFISYNTGNSKSNGKVQQLNDFYFFYESRKGVGHWLRLLSSSFPYIARMSSWVDGPTGDLRMFGGVTTAREMNKEVFETLWTFRQSTKSHWVGIPLLSKHDQKASGKEGIPFRMEFALWPIERSSYSFYIYGGWAPVNYSTTEKSLPLSTSSPSPPSPSSSPSSLSNITADRIDASEIINNHLYENYDNAEKDECFSELWLYEHHRGWSLVYNGSAVIEHYRMKVVDKLGQPIDPSIGNYRTAPLWPGCRQRVLPFRRQSRFIHHSLSFIGSESEQDIWTYNLHSSSWRLIAGDSTVNPLPFENPYNKRIVRPPSLRGAAHWIDHRGSLHMFGGSFDRNQAYYNLVWKLGNYVFENK